MDLKVASTIGFERAGQPLLAVDDEDEFVRRALATLGPQPPNFQRIVALNRGPLVKEGVDAHPLTPRQVQQVQADGALVVDVRTELQFDEAHIPGAVCITARRAGFGSKLAWVARPDQPIALVGRDSEDALEAAELAGAVGLAHIAGFLAGGMTSWREDQLAVASVRRMTVEELHAHRDDVQVLDVRERSEWDAGHIPGLRPRAVPRHRGDARRHRPGAAGRGDLRLGPAVGGGGVAAAALRRLGRDPRGGRGRRDVAAGGVADRGVKCLQDPRSAAC
jgi:rhodanese-related sulfurtransferase